MTGPAAITTSHLAEGAIEARLDRSDRDTQGRRDFGQRQAEEVVQDDHRSSPLVKMPEHPIDEVPIGERGRTCRRSAGAWMSVSSTSMGRRLSATRLVDAGIDGESIQPTIEPVGVPNFGRSRQARIRPSWTASRASSGVAEDEASRLGPAARRPRGRARRRRHGRREARSTSPRWSTVTSDTTARPWWSSLTRYGVAVLRTVLWRRISGSRPVRGGSPLGSGSAGIRSVRCRCGLQIRANPRTGRVALGCARSPRSPRQARTRPDRRRAG